MSVGDSVEFADAACTVPVRNLGSALSSDALLAISDTTCPRWTISAITTAVEHTGPIFHSLVPDTCTEATREPTRTYYVAGTAVPIDRFPVVIARTE